MSGLEPNFNEPDPIVAPNSGVPNSINQQPLTPPQSSFKTTSPEDILETALDESINPIIRNQAYELLEKKFPEYAEKAKAAQLSQFSKFNKGGRPEDMIANEIARQQEGESVAKEEKPVEKPKKKKEEKKKVKPEVKVETSKKIDLGVNIKTQESMDSNMFDTMLSAYNKKSSEFFDTDISLPCKPSQIIRLRSMRVDEYKYLARVLETFESFVQNIDEDSEDAVRGLESRENALNQALDVVLERCMITDYPIQNLTMWDWLYSLLCLRMVSRGNKSNMSFRCKDIDCNSWVKIEINSVLENIEKFSNEADIDPITYVDLEEDKKLYISIPTRGDIDFVSRLFEEDEDASMKILTIAMSIKAVIIDDTAYVLDPIQRLRLFQAIGDYDKIQEINKIYNNVNNSFFESACKLKCEKCGKESGVNLGDFIWSMYDF